MGRLCLWVGWGLKVPIGNLVHTLVYIEIMLIAEYKLDRLKVYMQNLGQYPGRTLWWGV